MKSLFDYDFLVNDVFYRCWHILEYIEKHPDMSELDRNAIKATIMDALVYKGLINPQKESLDLDNFCIRDDMDHYTYELNPNVCGIPQWMKEEFRKKCLWITGGIPVSLYLASPPSKINRRCVYDPNTAVSSIFPDATFYNTLYISPTRGVKIDSSRPFVEVEINGELYFVDILTKRIFKSSYFKENYGLEIIDQFRVSKLHGQRKRYYQKDISTHESLSDVIPIYEMTIDVAKDVPDMAETIYEFQKCRQYYPEAFKEAEEFKNAMNGGGESIIEYIKNRKNKK